MNKCRLCLEHYAKYPLVEREGIDGKKEKVHEYASNFHQSPIECAFPAGVFSPENYGCGTMARLRELTGEDYKEREIVNFYTRDDMRNATIGVLAIPESDMEYQSGYLVMTWYKSRGATGQAYVMWDDNEPKPLTLETAEFILKEYKNL